MAKTLPVRGGKPPPAKPKSGGNGGGRSGGNRSGGGGGGGDSARAAENRAVARANADKKKAGKRFLAEAGNLEAQARALRYALKTSFAKARNQNLVDLDKVFTEQITALKEGHKLRGQQFLKAGSDTEKATGDTAQAGISNAVRERQDSMSGLLEQGAGETDTLRTMVMAARNWHANQSEANRAYFDTMRSVNQGIVDLNIDTKTAMSNTASTTESERERLWQDFFNRRSETFTQLGNIRGQQRDYYAQAKEMGVNPKKGAEKAAKKASEDAFMKAAKEAGKSYVNKGLPKWIKDWKGQEEIEARQSNTELQAAMVFEPTAKAQGATLRKWAA